MVELNFMKIISMVDQFGGKVGVTVQGNNKLYKTWFGAVGTLAIYSLGLVHFLYLFVLFATNHVQPNIAYAPSYIQNDRYHKFNNH
jgi:hypothetical protein